MRLATLFATLLTLALASTADAQSQNPASVVPPARIAVHAARLLDVETGRVVADPLVLVEGDKVVSVTAGGSAPAGMQVIELGNVTLLPGLIDVHVHLTSDPTVSTGNYYKDALTLGPMDYAVVAPTLARRTLDAGFTTVRTFGAGY